MNCIFFTALIFLSLLTIAAAEEADDCSGRRIHIRRLPSRFNLALLSNCSDESCNYEANHGLGLRTHTASRSWFRTDPRLLEPFFHRRMLEYPCLIADPALADAIYLPYYAGIDAVRYLYGADVNSSSDHGRDLYAFLRRDSPAVWGRRSGHDHFLVMARPAWDFSQPLSADPPVWGTSFLHLPGFFNVTALTFEARPWPWQEHAIPYPTSFHPPNLGLLEAWIRRVRRSRRTSLALFAGGGGTSRMPNIRRSIRSECDNSTAGLRPSITGPYDKICDMVDCSDAICEHDPILYIRPMLRSVFCLQPPGDTPTRRSTFDGIIAGCIPVFFEDHSGRTQYTWHLPEIDQFSVFIPKEDIVFGGVKIMEVLSEIPAWRVERMREKVVEMIPRVMYRRHGSSPGLRAKKDALDIAVEGALKTIAARLEEVSAQ